MLKRKKMTTEEKKQRNLLISVVGAIILFTLISVGLIRILATPDLPSLQTVKNYIETVEPADELAVVPAGEILRVLKKNAKLFFADISTTTPIPPENLPMKLQRFITSEAHEVQSLTAEGVNFVDGKIGYRVVYQTPLTVLDTYRLLHDRNRLGDFKLLSGTGKTRISLLELADEKYEIIIEINSTSLDGSNAIVIMVTQLKST